MGEPDHIGSTYRDMLNLWNVAAEQLDGRVDALVGDGFVIHQNGEQHHGAAALVDLIGQGRAPFENVEVSVDTGPVAEGDLVAARWSFTGTYTGGIPGASAPAGTQVTFTGLDLVRIRSGRVTEYWVCSDTTAFATQLQM